MGRERQIMYIDKTMHILDVISNVYRSSKCNKIVGGWGFAPDFSGGVYSALQTLLQGLRGLTSRPLYF